MTRAEIQAICNMVAVFLAAIVGIAVLMVGRWMGWL